MTVRAVLDTNVVLAAHRAARPDSPNAEVLQCWAGGRFTLLHSRDVMLEYAETLLSTGIPLELIARFLARVIRLGEVVVIEYFHLRHYPEDADDIAFLLCAVNGKGTHLVTYDRHLLGLQPHYPLAICESLAFLAILRTSA